MLDWVALGLAFLVVSLIAVSFWIVSVFKKNVSIVDSLWSMMFLVMLGVFVAQQEVIGARAMVLLGLVSVWAVRLSLFIGARNHGKPEDHRYQTIRGNNEPNFQFKSLYIVFGLQAVLAGFISLPLLAAASANTPLGWLDALGLLLWCIGMFFEVTGDQQLKSFQSNPASRGKVLDTGLWAYTRHPNYFGEFTLWWGYYCFALAAGGWWTILSPLLMSVLLLKVSGVALLESTIGQRRPGYASYVERTNAFFPWFPAADKTAGINNGSHQ